MRAALILMIAMSLAGCAKTLVPVTPTPVAIPALPPSLDQDPKQLPPIRGNSVSDVLMDSITSSRAYNALRSDYIDLRKTYNCVKSSGLDSKLLRECVLLSK